MYVSYTYRTFFHWLIYFVFYLSRTFFVKCCNFTKLCFPLNCQKNAGTKLIRHRLRKNSYLERPRAHSQKREKKLNVFPISPGDRRPVATVVEAFWRPAGPLDAARARAQGLPARDASTDGRDVAHARDVMTSNSWRHHVTLTQILYQWKPIVLSGVYWEFIQSHVIIVQVIY